MFSIWDRIQVNLEIAIACAQADLEFHRELRRAEKAAKALEKQKCASIDNSCTKTDSSQNTAQAAEKEKKRSTYEARCCALRKTVDAAKNRLSESDHLGALHKVSLALEGTLKILVEHELGEKTKLKTMDYLNLCVNHGILDRDTDFYNKINGVRKLRNKAMHVPGYLETLNHDTVHYAIVTVEEFVDWLEQRLEQ